MHSAVKIPCVFCGWNCSQFQKTEYHIHKHIKEKVNFCKICTMEFTTKAALAQHMLTHNQVRNFQCKVCSAAFKLNRSLKRHVDQHSAPRKFACEICGKSFKRKDALQVHIRNVHQKSKPFQCTICDLKFSVKPTLVMHMRQHTGEKPYQCDLCGKSFHHKPGLRQHLRDNCRRDESKTYWKCTLCSKTMKRSSKWGHLKKMHSDNRYICPVCNKILKGKDTLRVHLTTHIMDRPFKCRMCEKEFSTLENRKYHEKSHNKDQKRVVITCNICDKPVAKKGFRAHTLRHGDVKDFQCSFCNIEFFTKAELDIHLLSHLKERPHFCLRCGKEYMTLATLKIHVKSHN